MNVGRSFVGNAAAHFVNDGRRLAIFGRRSSGTVGVDVLGLPDLSQVGQIETSGEGLLAMRGDRLVTSMTSSDRKGQAQTSSSAHSPRQVSEGSAPCAAVPNEYRSMRPATAI